MRELRSCFRRDGAIADEPTGSPGEALPPIRAGLAGRAHMRQAKSPVTSVLIVISDAIETSSQ
jgi:hypothetical protein